MPCAADRESMVYRRVSGEERVNASLGPQAWGLERGYWDVVGRWREVPEETIRVVMETMGAGAGGPPAGPRS